MSSIYVVERETGKRLRFYILFASSSSETELKLFCLVYPLAKLKEISACCTLRTVHISVILL